MTPPARTPLGAHLPDFPWDTLAEAKATVGGQLAVSAELTFALAKDL